MGVLIGARFIVCGLVSAGGAGVVFGLANTGVYGVRVSRNAQTAVASFTVLRVCACLVFMVLHIGNIVGVAGEGYMVVITWVWFCLFFMM